ncbi:CinA family protein [Acidisoma cellulosilytica]|uniref:CinA family protein n=1 Tax=Acidisoma cellulosilyticum TaxID=2802395 RepID=A0A963YXZ3_9PROT|nr:nicotinamide-nucleotide amidohydrolase family protein [Acidisoma cellulosilyticum]MCB8879246.1 CinA family protein [Acidisoma cellulosilyticum]
MFPTDLLAEAETLLAEARARGWRITTAESCTGGLIAGLLTAIGGSSDVVDGGAVTYSNAAKTRMLGVPAETIKAHGAVSEPVARAMAEGAGWTAGTELAIAVTGVAGPGGGTAEKPVGLVWFGLATPAGIIAESHIFPGDRTAVRMATVRHAVAMLRAALDSGRRYA